MPTTLDHDIEEDFARVCALQCELRSPDQSPLNAARRVQEQISALVATAHDDIDIFVLPELSPIGYSEDTFAKYLPVSERNRTTLEDVDKIMQQTAKQLSVYICYGTIGWTVRDGALPTMHIRQKVVNRCGEEVTFYDKTYLCDYGDCRETRFFCPGPASQPVSFSVTTRLGHTFRFGLLICADMRYPELTRSLVAPPHLVDCVLQPAAFARDVSFRTWRSFRETRAVENSVFWIGVNYSGESFGESSVVPPWVDDDNEPVTLGTGEGHLIGVVSRELLASARTSLPFYRHLLQSAQLCPDR